MKSIQKLWKSSLIGKIVIGASSLFVFCCLCSIPIALISPPTPTPSPTELISNLIATQLAQITETVPATVTSIATSTSAVSATTITPITETVAPLSTATMIQNAGAANTQIAKGASCIPNNPAQTGTVVDVVDGDTIKVLLDEDGQTYVIRYIGMDTPESTTQIEYFGAEASTKNARLVFGKEVTLIKDVSETDRYGRLLRYVIVDGLFINYELVAQGYANTASYPPDVACIPTFQAAEQEARALSIGLWNAPPTLAVIPTLEPATGGGNAVCNCSGPDLDCKDFSSHASAQACYGYCNAQGYGDPHGLDGNDNDGLACESLP
jgi:micrococcal nuclease